MTVEMLSLLSWLTYTSLYVPEQMDVSLPLREKYKVSSLMTYFFTFPFSWKVGKSVDPLQDAKIIINENIVVLTIFLPKLIKNKVVPYKTMQRYNFYL